MDDPLTHLAQFAYFLFERWEGLLILGMLALVIWYRRVVSPLTGFRPSYGRR
jgi:hypothetical protein